MIPTRNVSRAIVAGVLGAPLLLGAPARTFADEEDFAKHVDH